MRSSKNGFSGLTPNLDGQPVETHFRVINGKIFDGEFNGTDWPNHWIFPALINIHDHLPCSWFRIKGGPFPDSASWIKAEERDFQRSKRKSVPIEVRTRLGLVKNFLSGVGTVLDHLPGKQREALSEVYSSPFLRVISNYRTEGIWRCRTSPGDFPSWGEGVEAELALSGPEIPFVIHLAEGTNPESKREFAELNGIGGITGHTIIVHGVALTPSDLSIMAQSGTSLVWCPCSNHTILSAFAPIREALSAGVSVALGSDSNLSGSANLLSEMRWAVLEFRRFTGEDLPLSTIWKMVTLNPASILGIQNLVGALQPGCSADFFLLKRRSDDPLKDLLSSNFGHIEALINRGKLILGSPEILEKIGLSSVHLELWKFMGEPFSLPKGTGDLISSIEKQIGKKLSLPFLPPCLEKE